MFFANENGSRKLSASGNGHGLARSRAGLLASTTLTAAILAGVALGLAGPAMSADWVLGTDYNTAINWLPANVPDAAGETAAFNGLGTAAVNVSAPVTVMAVTPLPVNVAVCVATVGPPTRFGFQLVFVS